LDQEQTRTFEKIAKASHLFQEISSMLIKPMKDDEVDRERANSITWIDQFNGIQSVQKAF
jgi:hypothetical protein